MNRWNFIMLVAVALALGCGKKDAAKPAEDPLANSGNPLLAPVDYLGAQARGKRTAAKTVGFVEIQSAIQQFHAMEDRYPKDLNELVKQGLLVTMPTPPPGVAWSYNPQTGEIRTVKQ
ncbi:MAG: hypothetical protein EXS36_16865 [Pedosphaera sp.]|nr:hypothetical protein [Pedosphaera sp.]